eukprot:TRINITY_DN6279_c0_g2_i1.p1 TRINITY_DN6279_c0_g2~~TRINITY_DN6279_c0_g2_i1.p1  ORF type:complete len:871 (-),score=214.37 TRINITY_DN6279_c0_g2_i1:57-2561(-)
MSWDRKPRQASALAESILKIGNDYIRDYDYSYKKKTTKPKKKKEKKVLDVVQAPIESQLGVSIPSVENGNVEMRDPLIPSTSTTPLLNGHNHTSDLNGAKTNGIGTSGLACNENWDSDGNIDVISVEDLVPETNGKVLVFPVHNDTSSKINGTHNPLSSSNNLSVTQHNNGNTFQSNELIINSNINTNGTHTNTTIGTINNSNNISIATTTTTTTLISTIITTTNSSENVLSVPLTFSVDEKPHIALVLRRKSRIEQTTSEQVQPKKKKSKKKVKLGNGLSDSEGDDQPLVLEGKDPIKMAKMIQRLRSKPFTYIKTNSFLGRSKTIEDDDSISVCFCVPIENEGGCGSNCVNRLTYMECNKDRCPCGDLCRNQRFQKMEYAKVGIIKTEHKGYGLVALESLQAGDFVYEYCGEVIPNEKCLERLSEATDESNFYFLTLDSRECIDASGKGNLARFMNHSCSPNCQTQKWYVAGELRVGLFAIRDIPVGSELTFDYNFERFGREKQKCYCQAPNCRGFLGEKPNREGEKKKGSAKRKNATKKSAGLPIFMSSPVLSSVKQDTPTQSSSSTSSMNNTSTNYSNVKILTPNPTEKSESKSSTVNSTTNGIISHINSSDHTNGTLLTNNTDINNNSTNNPVAVNASILKESEVLPDGTIIPSQPKKRKNLHVSDHDPYISYLLQNNAHYLPEHLREFILQTCHTNKFTTKTEKVVVSEVIETDGTSKKILTTEKDSKVVVPPPRLPVFLSRNVLNTREWWKRAVVDVMKKHGKLSPSKLSSNVVPNLDDPMEHDSHPTPPPKKRKRKLQEAFKTLGASDSSNFLEVLEKGFSVPIRS